MIFTSIEFWGFLIVVCLVHAVCIVRYRWLPLLVASYIFYGLLGWKFVAVLAIVTLINFAAGIAVDSASNHKSKRLWMVFGVCLSLAPLFVFKYTDFVFGVLQVSDSARYMVRFIIPVGLSFYTLQALNYTIDVYRGKISVEKHFGRFALYVAFFPQLLAGPIGRASNLLKQYRQGGVVSLDRMASGAQLIIWGLFQKMVVADRLAIYVDQVYADPSVYSSGTLLLTSYFFTLQIYCDFAGYSNIAIGVARMLGYDLLQNFRLPYFAHSITEFWRRWHISLTSWFRDYLYISMGGNRVSILHWVANIMVVFLVSGLWHGASWTFVIWGAIHGICYLIEKWSHGALNSNGVVNSWPIPLWINRAVGMIVTFHVVTVAWIFFRAPSIDVALNVIRGICSFSGGAIYRGPSQFTTVLSFAFIAVLLLVEFAQLRGWASLHASPSRIPLVFRWVGCVALIVTIAVFGISSSDFIYFQF